VDWGGCERGWPFGCYLPDEDEMMVVTVASIYSQLLFLLFSCQGIKIILVTLKDISIIFLAFHDCPFRLVGETLICHGLSGTPASFCFLKPLCLKHSWLHPAFSTWKWRAEMRSDALSLRQEKWCQDQLCVCVCMCVCVCVITIL
jgi:hypothetical protein